MKRVQLYLPEEDLDELKALASYQNKPYALMVREAVAEYLVEVKKKVKVKKTKKAKTSHWTKSLKLATNMGGKISQNIDDILYS